ncbi:hypothetical protein FLA_2821 [Filimonas lacunae]|nr:hypothetical protein FLA_2821 [Filimonas lacunae]
MGHFSGSRQGGPEHQDGRHWYYHHCKNNPAAGLPDVTFVEFTVPYV